MTTSADRDLLQSLSAEEANRLVEAMKDPQFVSLFSDYVKEISDPKARRENDEYLRQLEQQQSLPEGMKLLKPSPLFCIKLVHSAHGKLFVNVCISDLIDAPSSLKNDDGVTWNFPYSCSTRRSMPIPNSQLPASVVDVTFHSSIAKLMDNIRLRGLIEGSAVDGAEKVVNNKYSRPYRILSKVKCKDGPPAIMRIGGDSTPDWKMPSFPDLTKPTKESTDITDHAVNAATDQDFSETCEMLELGKKPVPRYEIIHRGDFQLQECTLETPFVVSNRPKTIIVKIYLPEVDSLSNWTGVELDAHIDSVKFEIKGLYSPLEIKLPYQVDHDSGRAKFSSTDRVLSVTFSVIQQEPILKHVQD